MVSTPHPASPNAALLRQGIELIDALDDDAFRAAGNADGWGGVGAQLRHVVDFYASFLRDLPAGRIDYDRRERRADLESDRGKAAGALASAVDALLGLSGDDLARPLAVRDEDAPGWSASSAGRELSFLLSHTVHHFALVRLMLEARRVPVSATFGVAPSTLRHWAGRA